MKHLTDKQKSILSILMPIILIIIIVLVTMPFANSYVRDDLNCFNTTEKIELNKKLKSLEKTYHCPIYVVTDSRYAIDEKVSSINSDQYILIAISDDVTVSGVGKWSVINAETLKYSSEIKKYHNQGYTYTGVDLVVNQLTNDVLRNTLKNPIYNPENQAGDTFIGFWVELCNLHPIKIIIALMIVAILLVILFIQHNKNNNKQHGAHYIHDDEDNTGFVIDSKNTIFLGTSYEVLHGYYKDNSSRNR